MNLIKYIKKLLGIADLEAKIESLESKNYSLRMDLNFQREEINNKLGELKQFARVDADIGFRGNNTIILTGAYRNKGYVQFYDMGNGEFANLIEELKYRQKSALIRHIDKPAGSFIGEFDL